MRKVLEPTRPTLPSDDAIFRTDGRLRRELFEAVLETVDATSSSGYPFMQLSPLNSGFMKPGILKEVLYSSTDRLMSEMLNGNIASALSDGRVRPMELLHSCVYPVNVFVKNEPTKIDKVARLIYGTPLNFAMVCRILFGDHLANAMQTCYKASHKVGMDMYTDEGVQDIINFFTALQERNPDKSMYYSDIQGWEYASNEEMHKAWFDSYVRLALRANPRATKAAHMVRMIGLILLRPFLAFSDGRLFVSPVFFVLSGVLITHKYNSDMRAALSKQVTRNEDECGTNGDDCLELSKFGPDHLIRTYSLLGFVITDVELCTPQRILFSSQEFVNGKRIPTSLTKAIVNYWRCKIRVGREEIRWFVRDHPRFADVDRIFQQIDLRYPV